MMFPMLESKTIAELRKIIYKKYKNPRSREFSFIFGHFSI